MTPSPVHHPASVNIDALWLRSFAESFAPHNPHVTDEELAIYARLLRVANNIDALDHANSQAYALGVTEGEARVFARSNLQPDSTSISKRQGRSLLDVLNDRPVTKVPMGVRALDDAPDKFNSRKVKPTDKPRAKLAIDLDLSDI